MNCKNCGFDINGNEKFCMNCGNAISKMEDEHSSANINEKENTGINDLKETAIKEDSEIVNNDSGKINVSKSKKTMKKVLLLCSIIIISIICALSLYRTIMFYIWTHPRNNNEAYSENDYNCADDYDMDYNPDYDNEAEEFEIETSPYSQYIISDTGYCGQYDEFAVVWNYYEDINAIEFIGNGSIKDYSYYDEERDIPWYHYRETIEQVYISNGITRIGNRVFEQFKNITEITIPETVESIGQYEFWACYKLENIYLPNSIVEIGDSAFGACRSLNNIYYSGTLEKWNSIDKADDIFSNTDNEVTIYYDN